MSDKAKPKRAFDYDAFIGELRPLILQGRSFNPTNISAHHEVFRHWLREVKALLHSIKLLGYKPVEHLGNRGFGEMSETQEDGDWGFGRDMKDTLSELEILVAMFDKYGDPKAIPDLPTPPPAPSDSGARTSVAKLHAVQSALIRIFNASSKTKMYSKAEVDPYLKQLRTLIELLRHQSPDWYGDAHTIETLSDSSPHYSRRELDSATDYLQHLLAPRVRIVVASIDQPRGRR